MIDDPFELNDESAFEPAPAAPQAPPPWLSGLNPEQAAAVTTTEGPLLVLSGAGTGKTRVLTTRLAHILHQRLAPPWNVLAVTFTNRAAKEMRERLGAMIGPVSEQVWLGTFHALGLKMLRRHCDLVGLRSGFSILDTDDQNRVLKGLMELAHIDTKKWPPNVVMGAIQRWKDRGWTPDAVPPQEVGDIADGKALELYRTYQKRLIEVNACDFGDLLLHVLTIFQAEPGILAEYQARFRYILVDEYQDTNVSQYLWLRLLARQHKNICCVGDDDQCLVAGTEVAVPGGGGVPIETVREGDQILAALGRGRVGPATVSRIHARQYCGEAVEIVTEGGRTLTSTLAHRHFAGYRRGRSPQVFFTYLMMRQGRYRLGTSQVYTRGQVTPVMGFELRCRQEKADALWIVSTHKTENAARYQETLLSLHYGIPTFPFVARKGKGVNGLVHDQALLDRLFSEAGGPEGAERLLDDLDLSRRWPHYRPQAYTGRRRNITITLCGDARSSGPLHRISVIGGCPEDRAALEALGLSVRAVKKAHPGWRFETSSSDLGALMETARRIEEAFGGDVALVQNAALGNPEGVRVSLPMIPASSVRDGMVMFLSDGGTDVVRSVRRVRVDGSIHDLDVARVHNYVANGVVTHNSIYSWRGAEVGNILRFEHDFPGANIVRLERNYRSTPAILGAASGLIRNNATRLGKDLRAAGSLSQDVGDKVTIHGVWDGEAEARWVLDTAESLQRNGARLSNMAILVRAGFQTREFEERFITTGTPYRMIGGLRFYERAEIRDAIAYVRLLSQPDDDLAFERIVNLPKRGLGDASIQVLHMASRAQGLSLLNAARTVLDTDELKPRARNSLRTFVEDIDRWATLRTTMAPAELVATVLDESGYLAMWKADKAPEAPGRVENLQELVSALEDYTDLQEFLEHIALVMENDTRAGIEDAITLMTLHAAKGLEFDHVFLPGWEEQVFPHRRALEGGLSALEEERRLAYVGLTRARRRAFISYAGSRRVFNQWHSNPKSRFVDEIPAEFKEEDGEMGLTAGSHGMSESYSTWNGGWGKPSGKGTGWERRKAEEKAGQNWQVAKREPSKSGFSRGDRVFHQKFGYGEVTAAEDDKLQIAFDKAGQKKVMAGFVKPADEV